MRMLAKEHWQVRVPVMFPGKKEIVEPKAEESFNRTITYPY